jgi:uncharacterized membrane protein YcjF (UPF0283 family)
MIGIAWVDGIRRQPPIAGESKAVSTLKDETREVVTERVIGYSETPPEKAARSGEDDAGKHAASLSDDNPDQWEQFRNIPTRYRIDEDGRRRRRLAKMALATVLVALVFAIVLWARHQWKEAWVRMPVVYGEMKPARTVTGFLSVDNAMAKASAIFLPSKKLACQEESDG